MSVVVDAAGEMTNAIVGELIMQYAQQRGCAGFVIEGAVRDIGAFAREDFPCFARGVSHRGPYKTGPAMINVPVSVGRQVVHPGDLVVGDEDGLVTFALQERSPCWQPPRAAQPRRSAYRKKSPPVLCARAGWPAAGSTWYFQ